jgi:RimJ/RimL family protein N-acetyltransferase
VYRQQYLHWRRRGLATILALPSVCGDNAGCKELMVGLVFRAATLADVDGILDVQEPGAVQGLAHIFPQEQHPFPREALAERWRAEIADRDTAVYVATNDDGQVTGFAARRSDELLHFGTAVELWGSGLAAWLHDELLKTYPTSVMRLRLRVFAENHRARRFYERRGWVETGVTSAAQFAPNPVLIEYARKRDLQVPNSGIMAT